MNYDELVAAATVGVGARPIVPDALPAPADGYAHVLAADPPIAVLDAAALLDAAYRAGGFAPRPVELPTAAPSETTGQLPGPAVRLLLDALGHDRLLASELMTGLAGRHAPARFLPALLSAAARDTVVRAAIAGLLGRRGPWLAEQHPDWRRVLASTAADVDVGDESIWATGRPHERLAWFAARRAADPHAARALLEAGWAAENGDDRTALVGALRPELTTADEPLLERALDDRKGSVRDAARELLGVLPGSAFEERAIERGAAAIRIERRGLRRQLLVTLPPEPDAAATRDGVPAPSRRQPGDDGAVGDGARRLIHVVAAVPLAAWPRLLGADAAGLAELRVPDWHREVHVGWRLRVVAEANPEWARALLPHPLGAAGAAVGAPADPVLTRLLPVGERLAPVLAAVRDGRLDVDGDLVPTPWPADLIGAVVAAAAKAVTAPEPGPGAELVRSLGRHVVPDAAGAVDVVDTVDSPLPATLRELAERARTRTDHSYQAQTWARALDDAAESLDLRRRLTRELTRELAREPAREPARDAREPESP